MNIKQGNRKRLLNNIPANRKNALPTELPKLISIKKLPLLPTGARIMPRQPQQPREVSKIIAEQVSCGNNEFIKKIQQNITSSSTKKVTLEPISPTQESPFPQNKNKKRNEYIISTPDSGIYVEDWITKANHSTLIEKKVTQKSLFINKQELAPKIINEEAFETKQYLDEKQAEKRSIAEIKERIKNAEAKPKTLDVQSTRYVRNPDVVVIAKINAKGKCQLCQKEAPFKDSKGKPFLEIHHIKWLAEGGDDKPENTVALCPNCHRKMHIRNLPEDRAFLFKRISTYKH